MPHPETTVYYKRGEGIVRVEQRYPPSPEGARLLFNNDAQRVLRTADVVLFRYSGKPLGGYYSLKGDIDIPDKPIFVGKGRTIQSVREVADTLEEKMGRAPLKIVIVP